MKIRIGPPPDDDRGDDGDTGGDTPEAEIESPPPTALIIPPRTGGRSPLVRVPKDPASGLQIKITRKPKAGAGGAGHNRAVLEFKNPASFDLAEDLALNLRGYSGPEWFAFVNFPTYMLDDLGKLRALAAQQSPTRPANSPAVACCLNYGLQAMAINDDVQGLMAAKVRLDAIDPATLDADDSNDLWTWFHNFPLSIPDEQMHGLRRLNATLPTQIKTQLFEMAAELGASASTLGVIVVGMALQTMADRFPDGHREAIGRMVERFYVKVARRRSTAEGFLKSVDEQQQGGATE